MDDIYKLETLYFYWVNCDDIWFYSHQEVDLKGLFPEELVKDAEKKDLEEYAKKSQAFWRLTIAYGLLYVVVEAYQQLKISDYDIDLLLKETNHVDQLRKLRNGVFHYQADFMSSRKVMDFIDMENSHLWVNDLKNAFEQMFLSKLPLMKDFFDRMSSR